MMICVGSATPTFFNCSKPLFSLAPASFKLSSSFDLAARHRSSFENSWNTTFGRSLHSDLSFVAAGLTEYEKTYIRTHIGMLPWWQTTSTPRQYSAGQVPMEPDLVHRF